jgi:hypothetical protein
MFDFGLVDFGLVSWMGERVVELGSGIPVEFDQRIDVRWLIGGEEDGIMGGG